MTAELACPCSAAPPEVPLPELLAPAGDWECAKAAVENGADAIYFGLEKFNARMRAHNFTEADLPALMEFLHRRGVKGYVTFNILVFENEMADARRYARAIIAAGADAAIVQDVGICRLLRQLSPDFPIHVSTQMTVTSAGGIEFARDLGCNLVIMEEIVNPSLLEFEIRGKIEKKASWARLRIELFDRDNINEAATSYEDDYLTVDLNPNTFRHLSFPVLGIAKFPHRVQFMIVGPAKSKLEIKNVVLR